MEWSKKNPRFIETYDIGNYRVFVDKETGVNYLVFWSFGGDHRAMSVLLDKDGKPIVTPIEG